MGGTGAPLSDVALIAAMITPALLILASASLVASALLRMARVVDRARVLAAAAHGAEWEKLGASPAVLQSWLESHARRARHAERSIALLYLAIVVFIATCLSIALDRVAGGAITWLPASFAIAGTLLLLAGGALMVAESRLSGAQIRHEIRLAQTRIQEQPR